MNQKRFLTAGEVFQLFGVDTETLDQLVESGDVQALQDLGSFKYRREDFVKLVQDGRLSPRTSGEMFQVDSHGDIPFLKLKQDDEGMKFDEDVEFLELDEDALNEQASQPTSKTPIGPESRLSDSDESSSTQTSREVPVVDVPGKPHKEQTDFELTSRAHSESDVRLVSDDTIDFDEPSVASTGSDSDVRLSGPVSSTKSSPKSKGDSDSGVRFFKMVNGSDESDSDVTMLSSAAIPPAPKGFASSSTKHPESDSDVQIAPTAGDRSASDITAETIGGVESDSDIILIGSPGDLKSGDASKTRSGKKSDSDSDVRLANQSADLSSSSERTETTPAARIHADTDSDVQLSDSSVRLGPAPVTGTPAELKESANVLFADDLNLDLLQDAESDAQAKTVTPVREDAGSADFESDLRLHQGDDDHGISREESGIASEFASQSSATDSEIAVEPDSGISLEADPGDSGLTLDQSAVDRGISLEPTVPAVQTTAAKLQSSSDIVLSGMHDDSNVRFGADQDSGISLDVQAADSGIMLDQNDSGIRFDSAGDSGISLSDADSGIAVASGDSGISLEDDSEDLGATFVDKDLSDFETIPKNVSHTETFESRDSGFDVSLAESDHTMEMELDEEESSSDTIVPRGKKGSPGSKSLDLSEAFQLDEPLEVEDLDISEDLDAAVGSDFSDEFASVDEEVVEVSDEDFSAEGVSAIAEADDESLETTVAAAPKRRVGPTEPPWGMAAVAPIIGASLAMAVTVLVLWGGVSTMWDGSEAGGPAAMLISTLGGLL